MSNFVKLSTTLGLKFGPVRKGVTPKKVLEYVLNDLVMIQVDNAMETNPTTLAKYAGMTESLTKVAHFIAPYKNVDIVAEPAIHIAEEVAKTVASNGAK